jgi:site-specific DNA recombinase
MLEKNATMGRRNAKKPFLLTGLVKCASCGYTFTGGRKTKIGKKGQVWRPCFYRCSARGQRAPHIIQEIACPQSQISCSILETAVWSVVCKVLLEPQILIDSLEQDFAEGDNVQLAAEIRLLEKRLREKDLEDEKLYRAYLADVFDEREFAARRKILKESRKRIAKELEETKDRVITKEELEERKNLILSVAQNARESGLAMDAPFEVKQRIIKLVVDKVVLNVNEDWFRIEGVIRGRYSLNEDIECIPMGRGSLGQ